MRDAYFYKSCMATMAVYIVLLCSITGFVWVTGLTGVFIIGAVVLYFLCYFYGFFDKTGKQGNEINKS